MLPVETDQTTGCVGRTMYRYKLTLSLKATKRFVKKEMEHAATALESWSRFNRACVVKLGAEGCLKTLLIREWGEHRYDIAAEFLPTRRKKTRREEADEDDASSLDFSETDSSETINDPEEKEFDRTETAATMAPPDAPPAVEPTEQLLGADSSSEQILYNPLEMQKSGGYRGV